MAFAWRIYSYVETLDMLLEKISSSKSTREDIVNWFVKSFENVSSMKTASGYLNVPKNMGLIKFENGFCVLTSAGEEYYKSKNKEFLFKTISDNILAFGEIQQFLIDSEEPKTEQDILEFIVDNFNVEWSTLAQVNFRLLWLINIGKVEKTENGYVGK